MYPLLMAAAHRNEAKALVPKPKPHVAIFHRRSITPANHDG